MPKLPSWFKKASAIGVFSAVLLLLFYVTNPPAKSFLAYVLGGLIVGGGWYLFLEVIDLRYKLDESRKRYEDLCAGLEAVWPKLDEEVKIKLHDASLGWVDTDPHGKQPGNTGSSTHPGGATPGKV